MRGLLTIKKVVKMHTLSLDRKPVMIDESLMNDEHDQYFKLDNEAQLVGHQSSLGAISESTLLTLIEGNW